MRSDRLEYSDRTLLKGAASKYIVIPEKLILDKDISSKRIGIYSYFYVKKGLDQLVSFTSGSIIEWFNIVATTYSRKVIISALKELIDHDYLSCNDNINSRANLSARFNEEKIDKLRNEESFAVLYLDEILTILDYKNILNTEDGITNITVLLVFAYFRNKIYRRKNFLSPEEFVIDEDRENPISPSEAINRRRKKFPEAFGFYYKDVAKDLGISRNTLVEAVNILLRLGMIVIRYGDRVPIEDKGKQKYTTAMNIAANRYKREQNYLLDDSESYSKREIENKLMSMNKYFRKNKKKGGDTNVRKIQRG